MKRLFVFPSAAALLMSLVPTAGAQDSPCFEVSSVKDTIAPGDEFVVKVEAKNGSELSAFRVKLSYDNSAFTLLDAEGGDFSPIFGPLEKDPFVMLWLDGTGTTGLTNGVICELTFKCSESAKSGSYEIIPYYEENDVVDFDGNGLDYELVTGIVNVAGDNGDKPKTTTTAAVTDAQQGGTTAEPDGKKTTTTKKTASSGDSSSEETPTETVTDKDGNIVTIPAQSGDESSAEDGSSQATDERTGGNDESSAAETAAPGGDSAEDVSQQSASGQVIYSSAEVTDESGSSDDKQSSSFVPAVIVSCLLFAAVIGFGVFVFLKKKK